MEITDYINHEKELYNLLLLFLESEDENSLEFEEFKEYFEKIKEFDIYPNQKHDELISLLRLVVKISNNHHRTIELDKQIELLFINYKKEIEQILSNSEIFYIIKGNKRILLFLIQNKILTIDQDILNYILTKDTYFNFFYPEIKSLISEEERRTKEENLLSIDKDIFLVFDEKRRKGENDSYICTLIREDLVDEFVSYSNRSNLSLKRKIDKSFFETNSFLLNKEPTLIEYAAFFGSLQIFNYLRMNNVELTEELWPYAIHSKNAELIHLLEDHRVGQTKDNYCLILNEAIKCHHNDIANYIQENLIENEKDLNITKSVFKYFNYSFFPDILDSTIYFPALCQSKHQTIVSILMNNVKLEINEKNEVLKSIICFIQFQNNIYF